MDTEHPCPSRWWKHRRRGYYAGMWWAAIQTLGWVILEFCKPGIVASLAVVVGWSYGISATLIISYFGNNIAEAWAGKVNR
ncbi:hypothetical protein [Marinobacter sp. JSM 1782161]|uniref:hypothetical protein n=1 Tax=Marinobacter sp. JSM 1782161 TaxID=2685906 RepID=UPI001403A7A1|nr:hypothetical protein [Marinobacter sp. JSM 1782161]